MRDLAAAFHDEHPGRGRRSELKLHTRWLTCHETGFLRTTVSSKLRAEAVQFLRGYLEGAARRVEWGDIARASAIRCAEQLLLNLEAAA